MRKQKKSADWQTMVEAAKRGLLQAGYAISRMPGRGLSNLWTVERDGTSQTASIRTTRNRWIAFPPLEGGTKWKTLDDVDLVVVAAVDSEERPDNVEVYIFPASEVRRRFEVAYAARIGAGQTVKDDFGMWVGLDTDKRDIPTSAGSGLAETSKPVATFTMKSLAQPWEEPAARSGTEPVQASSSAASTLELSTIADVMAWARQKVADIAGVRAEAVKLDLKIEY